MSSNRQPGGALINRRQLLKAGMAGGLAATLSGCSLLPRKADYAPDQYVGAVGLPGVSSALVPSTAKVTSYRSHRSTPVATADVHARMALRSSSSNAGPAGRFTGSTPTAATGHIASKPLPGTLCRSRSVLPDGRWLYVTASRYEPGQGIIAVYDAEQNYQRVDTFELQGIGPHELTLHPDGETLVIGLGGILTHPDYDRLKLNLDTMEPALILMNRRSGRIIGRFNPAHHQQSARHVSTGSNGRVYVAYQYQGPFTSPRPHRAAGRR